MNRICTKNHYIKTRDEVRISELSEIRIYSDHFGDRKSMPQIRIFEYTIFRAFFLNFHHFPLHFPHHYVLQHFQCFLNNIFFIFGHYFIGNIHNTKMKTMISTKNMEWSSTNDFTGFFFN